MIHSSSAECKRSTRRHTAFSLIELLVSMTILLTIMVLVSTMLGEIEGGWTRVRSRSIEFRDARTAFEIIANRLSQARIDSYWDYEMDQGYPINYRKSSHLHFVASNASDLVPPEVAQGTGHSVFFEAPFGMSHEQDLKGLSSLINGWGYFAGYSSDSRWQPKYIRNRIPQQHRFRLFEFHLPTEKLRLHSETEDGITGYEWVTENISNQRVSILAKNVIAFLIQPAHSIEPGETHKLATKYRFDSRAFDLSPSDSNVKLTRHEIPPIIKMTMVVVAESDFARFQGDGTTIPSVFDIKTIAPFSKSINFDKDLKALKDHFEENRIDYRVFTTAIALRSAKSTNPNLGPSSP